MKNGTYPDSNGTIKKVYNKGGVTTVTRSNEHGIVFMQYNENEEVLTLRFKSSDRLYNYLNVGRDIFEAMNDAPSPTGYFDKEIRNNYVTV